MEAITLRDLITNPPGAYSRQVAARYTIIDALTSRYREARSNPITAKRFKVSVTRNGDNKYLVWVKVPSSKYAVDYDVIFDLTVPEGVRTVNGAEVKVYCNSPSWVFTLGFVAAKQGFLISGWEKSLGRAATDAPKVTNPDEVNGFDRIVFQAVLFLTSAGLVTRADLDRSVSTSATKPSSKDPSLSAEAKLFEYQRAKDVAVEEHRRAKERDKRAKDAATKAASIAAKKASQSKATGTAVKTVKSAKSVGSSKQIGIKKRR